MSKLRTWVPLFGLALSSLLIVELSRQLQARRNDLRDSRLAETHLWHGQTVPVVPIRTLTGDSIVLGSPQSGRRQVWLVFNTSCRYCINTLWGWRRLNDEIIKRRVAAEVIGISLDSAEVTSAYVKAHRLAFPVVTLSDPVHRAALRLGSVPATAVVAESGRILHVRHGSYGSSKDVDSLLAAVAAVGRGNVQQ